MLRSRNQSDLGYRVNSNTALTWGVGLRPMLVGKGVDVAIALARLRRRDNRNQKKKVELAYKARRWSARAGGSRLGAWHTRGGG